MQKEMNVEKKKQKKGEDEMNYEELEFLKATQETACG